MLDPRGHLSPILPTKRVVLICAGNNERARWAAAEVASAGFVPVRTVAARHISTSLAIGALPSVHVVVVDFDGLSRDVLDALYAARWQGYNGAIIAISQAPLDPKLHATLEVHTTVAARAPDALALAIRGVT